MVPWDDNRSADSRTPIASQYGAHKSTSTLRTVIRFTSSTIFSPTSATYDPILLLLNTEDEQERDHLTEQWRDNKLAELSFVGIVSALLAGVLTSTGSWPDVLPNGVEKPWSIRTSWYTGIILALASILCAADQTIRLHRLSTHRDAMKQIRNLLSERTRDSEGKRRPRRMQIYTWQLPVLFMSLSVICMVLGMLILVWCATWRQNGGPWWNDNAKAAVAFTILGLVTLIIFIAGQISLYTPTSDFEDD